MIVNEILLTIGGQPQGKGRPKFGQGRAWTPKETKLAEGEVVRKWEEAGEPHLPDDTAIRLVLNMYVVRPGGHFKRDGTLSAEGLRCPRPFRSKPDVDNAIKLVMDALNKRAYKDDVRICSASIERYWAEWPYTEIELTTL